MAFVRGDPMRSASLAGDRAPAYLRLRRENTMITIKTNSPPTADCQLLSINWVIRDDVALATFPDGHTAFQAADCRMLALNETAAKLLQWLHLPQSLDTLLALIDKSNGGAAPINGSLPDLLDELESLRLIKRRVLCVCRWKETCSMNETARYLANPDVSCRIEDEDGAILYNPDTKSCQVINAVGLELWQHLGAPRSMDELTDHLCDTYDEVTRETATNDSKTFIQALILHGFIGEVEEGRGNGG